MTLEPDGKATGCNPVQVGSTPTGVSLQEARTVDTVRPAACVGPVRVSWRTFRTWALKRMASIAVSSVGRAPDKGSGCHGFDSRTVHQRCRLVTDSKARKRRPRSPREAGVEPIGRGWHVIFARPGDFPATILGWSWTEPGRGSMRVTGSGSANECHEVRGYRFWRPPARRHAEVQLRPDGTGAGSLLPTRPQRNGRRCRRRDRMLKQHSALEWCDRSSAPPPDGVFFS